MLKYLLVASAALLFGAAALGQALFAAPAPATAQIYPTCEPGGGLTFFCDDTRFGTDPTALDLTEIVFAPVGPRGTFVYITMDELADLYIDSPPSTKVAILTSLPREVANRLVMAVLYKQARRPAPVVNPIYGTPPPIPTIGVPFFGPTSTPPPGPTTTPTNTPAPGAPATPTPTTTPSVPPVNCVVTASVASPAVPPGAFQTVFGRLTCNGVAVPGVTMFSNWIYPGQSVRCDGAVTNSDGIAACTLGVLSYPSGTAVVINVGFVFAGSGYGNNTGFVVQ